MPRKAVASPGKRKAINTKITDDVREALEEAAKRNDRTLSGEMEHRLEMSFEEERRSADQSDGEKLMLRAVGRCWEFLQARISDRWSEHESGKAAMRHAMLELIDFGLPAQSLENMGKQDRVEFEQIVPEIKEVVDAITWRDRDPLKEFPNNRLMQAASGPISFTEAHSRWLRRQKS